MYTLVLSRDEREAIDWVGHRYDNGDDLYGLLCDCSADEDWDFDGPITFHIPEHVAWGINRIRDEYDGRWPCFSDAFSWKLNELCDSIV